MPLYILNCLDKMTDVMMFQSLQETGGHGTVSEPVVFNVRFSAADLEEIKSKVDFQDSGEFRVYDDRCAYKIAGRFRLSEVIGRKDIRRLKSIKQMMETSFHVHESRKKIDAWSGVVCYKSTGNGNDKLILILNTVSVYFDLTLLEIDKPAIRINELVLDASRIRDNLMKFLRDNGIPFQRKAIQINSIRYLCTLSFDDSELKKRLKTVNGVNMADVDYLQIIVNGNINEHFRWGVVTLHDKSHNYLWGKNFSSFNEMEIILLDDIFINVPAKQD